MTTQEVANRLVSLRRKGQMQEAQEELYGDTMISLEPAGAPVEKAVGLKAVVEKGKQFASMIEERQGLVITEPVVSGNQFSMGMTLDATRKGSGRDKSGSYILRKTSNF
jgi:hypothetical protein